MVTIFVLLSGWFGGDAWIIALAATAVGSVVGFGLFRSVASRLVPRWYHRLITSLFAGVIGGGVFFGTCLAVYKPWLLAAHNKAIAYMSYSMISCVAGIFGLIFGSGVGQATRSE